MNTKTPTLKDIATELGVSISTVSRALRGMPEINLETREAVLKLSKNLDYKLPSSNHAFAGSGANLIGALVPKLDYHFLQIIKGMDEAAIAAGFTLLICNTNDSYGREVTSIHRLLNSKMEGFVIARAAETSSFEHFNKIVKSNIPIAFIDSDCSEVDSPSFLVDNFDGGYQVVKHLIEKGYHKICFLGAKGLNDSKYAIENGILLALKEGKVDNYERKFIFGDFNEQQAFEKTAEILKMNDRPDAFFAPNNQVAIGIFRAVTESGYNIPKDIGIVGYFDEPMMNSFSPSISSVSVPSAEIGKLAINSLIDQIHLGSKPTNIKQILKPTLIIRESTNQSRRFFGI